MPESGTKPALGHIFDGRVGNEAMTTRACRTDAGCHYNNLNGRREGVGGGMGTLPPIILAERD